MYLSAGHSHELCINGRYAIWGVGLGGTQKLWGGAKSLAGKRAILGSVFSADCEVYGMYGVRQSYAISGSNVRCDLSLSVLQQFVNIAVVQFSQ